MPSKTAKMQTRWQDQRVILNQNWRQLPDLYRQWLLDQRSLTRHLNELSNGKFQVRPLHQYWGSATTDEYHQLGIATRQRCLVREVVLYGGEQAWIFARSILPESSLHGKLRRLRQLQQQSLGKILFNQTNLQRSAFQIAQITPANGYLPQDLPPQLPYYQAHDHWDNLYPSGEPLWARRCRFTTGSKPILVAEVFLPDLMVAIADG